MKTSDLDIDLFLRRLLAACRALDGVVVRPYAVRRAFQEMGWGIPEIKAFLLIVERSDFVRREAARTGTGDIWMFMPFHEDFGDIWIELLLLRDVVVVSFHPSDGEGEP